MWPTAGSESCVLPGQPDGRSVDSACQGRVIEPRNHRSAGSLRCFHDGGRAGPLRRPDVTGPAGVGDQGVGTSGFPRNLGGPVVSIPKAGVGLPDRKTPGSRAGVGREERYQSRRKEWYCQAKENEARQEGRPDVGALHSTVEPGEPTPWGAWGGKGASGSRNRWRETWPGHRNREPCPRNNNG